MRGVDTNVLVRFLTNDHEAQNRRATQIMAAGDVVISSTVVLETEWVLRGAYRFTRSELNSALREVGGMPGVYFEDPAAVAQALDWHRAGMDFADALHLSSASRCTAFLTFDRKLAKRARLLAKLPVEVL